MQRRPIPLVILGGADRRGTQLPPAAADKHPLAGYKGVDIRLGGRPLVGVLIERLRDSGAFDPIVIAGPERIYRPAGIDAQIIDTDGNFGHNLRMALEGMQRLSPGSAIGITTCDIVPDLPDLRTWLDAYHATAPHAFWYGLVRAPEDPGKLGAFGWKPRYRVAPAAGAAPVQVLPGHLVIADPEALRLDFLYGLTEIGYRTRNRPIASRRLPMILHVIWRLLAQDLIYLFRGGLPNLTWSVLGSGIKAGRKLRAGTITRAELERAVCKIFVKTRHRRRHRDRGVSLPILEGLTLAEDIDTEEEAQATQAGRKDTDAAM